VITIGDIRRDRPDLWARAFEAAKADRGTAESFAEREVRHVRRLLREEQAAADAKLARARERMLAARANAERVAQRETRRAAEIDDADDAFLDRSGDSEWQRLRKLEIEIMDLQLGVTSADDGMHDDITITAADGAVLTIRQPKL
jgi:hypothetical protein